MRLYLVPTPVGNLGDMTFRAVEVLKSVDLILAEDTRTSRVLMQHYGITTPLQSYHIFNEHQIVDQIVDKILSGMDIAVVTDAGTPGISDPGFLLVREVVKHDIEVECLPGATAFVPALIDSGLPCDRFVFEGFLPHKKGRQTKIQSLAEETRTMIIYESPFRLVKLLEQLIEVLGPERQVSVSREISKLHAETARGTLQEVFDHFNSKEVKGEIVVILAGKSDSD
ncbi:MAG: 16S rRNA (cytidine(1402)-2'-O)-methyltransferase [Bacteroidales bacterium]|nr:16S rRNA (cytidine(1402)-2'-O)-methyltransferase [Candidatus Colimorpha pelethequi]